MKKFLIVIVFILSCSDSVYSQNEKLQTQTSLPLQFNSGNVSPYGLPSTIISIQGRSIPIIVDSGATKSGEISLSRHALKYIKVRFTGKEYCFKTINEKRCQKEFIIPEIKLGNFLVKNVKGSLMSELWGHDKSFTKGFRQTEALLNGVIGLPFLSKFNILLDYPNSKIVFIRKNFKPNEYGVSTWETIKFEGALQTSLNLNDKEAIVRWDTGALPSIIRSEIASNYSVTLCPTDPSFVQDDCLSINPSIVTSGGKKISHIWFKVLNIPSYAPFDGLIGSNFYRENIVYFDFDSNNVYFKPVRNPHG